MRTNVGGIDRKLRIVVGVALIVMAATGAIGFWGYIGVVMVATGLARFCPAYVPFGFSSEKACCDKKSSES